jgi:hypothetical protein
MGSKARKKPDAAKKSGDRKVTGGKPHILAFALTPILVALVAAVLFLPSPALNVAGLGGDSGPAKAVIVDQLGATYPNPDFGAQATAILEDAGYAVDYVAPEDVTVDFYRKLPSGGYDFIVLRTHSTAEISRGDEDVKSVSLFTNEPYTRDRYYEEQVAGRIGFAQYNDGGEQYFGVTADFVRESMVGRLNGATVVMMGCQGLLNDLAAQAFYDIGAGDFISWDGLVSGEHTDAATEELIRNITVNGLPSDEAVTRTMAKVGPDPTYGSQLILAR